MLVQCHRRWTNIRTTFSLHNSGCNATDDRQWIGQRPSYHSQSDKGQVITPKVTKAKLSLQKRQSPSYHSKSDKDQVITPKVTKVKLSFQKRQRPSYHSKSDKDQVIYPVVCYRQTPGYHVYVLWVQNPPPPWPIQAAQTIWPWVWPSHYSQ